jgi:hypothetical protein
MCLLVAGAALAEEQGANSPIGRIAELDTRAGATIDLYGQYIWRGQTLVDDPVFQPGAYIGVGAFTGSIWGSYTLTDEKEWTEVDYILDYTRSLGFAGPRFEVVSVSLGFIYYDFPNLHAGDDSQEVYAAVAVDTFLSPSLTVYHDYDQGDGTYYEFAVAHSLPVDKLSLNLSAVIGYNDTQWDFKSSFSSALFGAGLTVPLTERVSFEPGVFYSAALDSQYDDEFFGGFSISVELWE